MPKAGRPPRIRTPPADVPSQDEDIEACNRARRRHVEGDALVGAIERGDRGEDVLLLAVHALAVEAASIRHEVAVDEHQGRTQPDRQEAIQTDRRAQEDGRDRSGGRQAWVDREPPYSEDLQCIYAAFIDRVRAVAGEVLPNAAEFMRECERALDGWEERLER